MSIRIMSMIFPLDFNRCARKMLAVRLADHADDDGCGIWPSVERLARECNLTERSVSRILKEFVEDGLLVVVREGGKGRFSTTRYDFDMTTLERLIAAARPPKPDETEPETEPAKGDSLSPLEARKGDSLSSKGDSLSSLGGQRVTQTIIEPSDNHHSQRADARETPHGVRERGKDEEGKTEEPTPPDPDPVTMTAKEAERDRRLFEAFGPYPGFSASPKAPVFKAWAELGDEQRAQITRQRVEAFEKHYRSLGRNHWNAVSTLLKDGMLFSPEVEAILQRAVVEAQAKDDGSQPLKPFGKAWMVVRLASLRRGPKALPADTPVHKRTLRAEWPFIHQLDHGPLVTLPPDRAISAATLEACESVGRTSDAWNAWADYHDRMGWPWIDPPDFVEAVWFPCRFPSEWKYFEPEQAA